MAGNYKCPICGQLGFESQEAANNCPRCASYTKICPKCNGTGQIVNWGAPNQKCDRCAGTGQANYRN